MAGFDEKWSVEKLDGSNWTTWKFQMKHLLLAKGLWGLVDGTETLAADANAAATAEYQQKCEKALASIVLGTQSSVLYLITSCDTAENAWTVLRQHFERDTLANKLFLKKQYFRMEMKEGMSVDQHLKKMKELTDKLSAIGAPITEEDQVVTLLGSLPPNYATLVTALEARSDDISLNYVQQALVHEERKQNGQLVLSTSVSKGDSVLVGAQSYPVKKGSGSLKKKIKCFNCGRYGHVKKNCWAVTQPTNSNPGHRAKVGESEQSRSLGAFGAIFGSVDCQERHYWLVDSGASSHMTWQKKLFDRFRELSPPEKVRLGDGRTVDAVGIGNIKMMMNLSDTETKPAVFYDVLYVPKLTCNLFSVKAATQRGNRVKFGRIQCWINGPGGECCGKGSLMEKLYYLDCEPVCKQSVSVATKNTGKLDLWHQRFGHVNEAQLREMIQKDLVTGVEKVSQNEGLKFCEGCVKGKMHRQSFKPVGDIRSTRKLQLVHSDVCGPMQTESLGGHRYFVTFIDDYSRCCQVHFMKHKSEVSEKFKEFAAVTQNECGNKIGTLRSDRGGEYQSEEFENYLKKEGIRHELSVTRCPQQNGVAERLNRTLVESARAMLSHAGLSNSYWAEAIATAVYIKNRTSTSAFKAKKQKMTPYEKWYGKRPNISHLRVFGCSAFAHIPDEYRRKLDQKAEKLRFVGYSASSKGYRLYDEKTRQVKVRRDVVFNETDFSLREDYVVQEEVVKPTEAEVVDVRLSPIKNERQTEQPEEPMRHSGRQRHPPVRFGYDEFADSAGADHQVHHIAYNMCQIEEPKSMKEALEGEYATEWKFAADSEYESLLQNETWELVELPPGHTPIGCKWVFKVKHDNNGQVERFKGRLVAKGYAQEYGVDYDETFSPVVKLSSIRALLAFAVKRKMCVHQMDVITAFLNGKLEQEIYMQQPEGYCKPGEEHLVCRLKKSLYGLKQSPRCWNKEFRNYMAELGFRESEADPCIFVRSDETMTIVAVYVDDLILLSESEESMKMLKEDLEAKFRMKDMGELHYCLGINVEIDSKEGSLQIHQRLYIQNILKKYGLMNVNPVLTPADMSVKLKKNDGISNPVDLKTYQSMVGSLIYAAMATRPDIAQAVAVVSKFCSNPSEAHLTAVKRIFRYLKGTANLGLKYCYSDDHDLIGYSDADWGGDLDDRHSTTGNIFLLSGGAISWLSKKQCVVSLSSTEAEYIALSTATQELVYLRRLLSDLGVQHDKPTVLMEDNQGTIALAQNPVFHARTKHIDIRHHYVREAIQKNVISLQYCHTKNMIADVLTKAVVKTQFQRLIRLMGLVNT